MKKKKLLMALGMGMTLAAVVYAAESVVGGVGFSATGDVSRDCEAAVKQAITALKGVPPKFVVCYYSHKRNLDQINAWVPEEVDTKAWAGASASSPQGVPLTCLWNKYDYLALCSEGYLNPKGAGAWALALGGAAEVRPLFIDLKEAAPRAGRSADYGALGLAVSRRLPARIGMNNLLLLFGNLHGPIIPGLADGLRAGYGERFPVYGGASSVNSPLVWKGNACQNGVVGVMVSGDFKVTMAGRRGNPTFINDAAANLEQEKEVYEQAKAAASVRGNPAFLLVNLCATRLWNPPVQHKQMAEFWKGVPIFGFYSGGEIGKFRDDLPCGGGGGCIVCGLVSE